MKNTQKGSAVVATLLAIIVIILGAGLYVYIQQNKKGDLSEYTSSTSSTTTPPNPETIKIETKPAPVSIKNTTPYVSKSLGISFDYPTGYELVDHGVSRIIYINKKGDDSSLNTISLSKDDGTVAEEIAKNERFMQLYPNAKLQTHTVSVDTKKGTQLTIDMPAGEVQEKGYTSVGIGIQEGNDSYYTFKYICAENNTECVDKSKAVIASIKFINR